MKKFYVHILGCQQNEHDGTRIKYLLENLGLAESKPEEADLIIVVACSVRQTAVDRVFGNVRNWQKRPATLAKGQPATSPPGRALPSGRRHQPPVILVTGCVLDSDKKKFAQRGVGFWDIEKPEELAKLYKFSDRKKSIVKLLVEGARFSSFVPIMFGCNNFCTYCATAFTRGRERSRKMSDVILDVKNLILKGEKEILLLGQTIDSYKDPETDAKLDTLFKKLNDLDGNFIISFTSNHPKDMTDKIIEAVATLPKIKKEIHLPIQSGSNKILKAMNRPYTRKQYLKIIKKIKSANKSIGITTDVIVGFPGETEKDFEQTVDIFKKVLYKMAYINKYSPRAGTAAYKLGDPISWQEKKRRWKILDKILRTSSDKFAK
ncbi:MAG: MiaB/RimO family radical SAM methylthiotransferase [Candidatus Berkelbacteria bacterium]|nr:MiaB/RimO family radical SAM methylthiotransferase [Candidatus Berkelbacteria bacterium]